MKNKKDILDKAVEALTKIPVSDVPANVAEATVKTLSSIKVECDGENDKRHILIERIRHMKKYTKIAVAAVIVCAVLASITVFDKTTSIAYALEQTIKASHTVRYIHIRQTDVEDKGPVLIWAKFNNHGELESFRMQSPDGRNSSPGEGPKIVVWQNNTAEVWLKKKNTYLIVKDSAIADQAAEAMKKADPKLMVQQLYDLETEGKVTIEVDEPADKSEPIIITVEFGPDSFMPGMRSTLFVDQATKLVISLELDRFRNNGYEKWRTIEFYDYNQPIDPKMFVLHDEIPADAIRIDQTTTEVGLLQDELSNDEIVAKVAREFFEALIAKDYGKAGILMEGMPADKMEKFFGKFNFLRIISIGEVSSHPIAAIAATKGFVIPCEIELIVDGNTATQTFKPGIRPVYNKPNRWTIFGGI